MSIRLDHIGIACENLEMASEFWRILGLIQGEDDHLVEDQGVTVRFFKTNDSQKSPRIELLEPTSEDTPTGKFLQKKGPGIQQICFEVDDIESTIARLVESDIVMILSGLQCIINTCLDIKEGSLIEEDINEDELNEEE